MGRGTHLRGTSSQIQSYPSAGPEAKKTPNLFLVFIGFCWTWKGNKFQRQEMTHRPLQYVKSQTGASVALFQTILICVPGSLTHYQMEICFQMPLGICHSWLVTFAHFKKVATPGWWHLHLSRRQTCPDSFKLPERCSPRKVLGSLADSTSHLMCFIVAELLLASSLEC